MMNVADCKAQEDEGDKERNSHRRSCNAYDNRYMRATDLHFHSKNNTARIIK